MYTTMHEWCGVWLKITNGTSEKALRGVVITEFSDNNWMGLGTKALLECTYTLDHVM